MSNGMHSFVESNVSITPVLSDQVRLTAVKNRKDRDTQTDMETEIEREAKRERDQIYSVHNVCNLMTGS